MAMTFSREVRIIPRTPLTIATTEAGTAAVAIELVRQKGCTVVGLDQSAEMLAEARRRIALAGLGSRISLVEEDARTLPFADAHFDALTFTYLLRYVDDPAATLRELARVVRPGGTIANVEFGVPGRPGLRALWRLWTRVGLPVFGRVLSRDWQEVGSFLGPSIEGFYERYPLPRLAELWREAGIDDVRVRRMSFGAGVVTTGIRR